MKQSVIELTEFERSWLNGVRRRGKWTPRQVCRANVLLALDDKKDESLIRSFLGVSSSYIYLTRKTFLEEGLERVMQEDPRPGPPPKFDAAVEAEVTALACSNPPEGRKNWTIRLLTETLNQREKFPKIGRESVRLILKKSQLKPWSKSMWCIGNLTPEYTERMHDLCDLYKQEENPDEPVICVDEKLVNVQANTRDKIPLKLGETTKEDYEYKRLGVRNIFIAVNPKEGVRHTQVTKRRTKVDFVHFIVWLVNEIHLNAKIIHIILDNLNTHFCKSFIDVLGREKADEFLQRVRFHYTPKHASWLNLAEVEIGVMARQCTGRRFASFAELETEVAAWERQRNLTKSKIKWSFTKEKADAKLSRHYIYTKAA